jgi:nitrate reductase NapE component
MTRYELSPLPARHSDEKATLPPRTIAEFALFMLFPVAIVLAVSFPVTAVAVVGGAVFAKLHDRWRTARRPADSSTVEFSRNDTPDE